MIFYCSDKSVNRCWKGATRIERKTGLDPLMMIRQWIDNFFLVQRKRKLIIKGIWNGELIFKIGTAFGGLCSKLP